MTYQFGGDGAQQAGVGMANRMKSEAPASHEDPGQEAMIELNEMADTAVDEDVIELTDVFSIPEDEQNGIIELTELATEEVLDPPSAPEPTEAGPAGGAAPFQDSGHDLLELADQATTPGASFENQSIDAQPEASLLSPAQTGSADVGGFAAPAENEASSEDELLDFGDLDLGSADLDAVSAPEMEADDASEEALFLDDEELVDFADQVQEAAGGSTAEEGAAAAETAGETQGLLDLEGLAVPPEEKTTEDDEFSDIFSDLGSGAKATAKSTGQPPADDGSQVGGDSGPEMAGPAPQVAEPLPSAGGQAAVKNLEEPEPLETGNGEEKFILSAGGIRMREKANGWAQKATPAPAQAAVATIRTPAAAEGPVVSAEQVEAAVERVVRRMFSDRLETMLMEVLEKAVAKEIQRIKNALLADSSESGTR